MLWKSKWIKSISLSTALALAIVHLLTIPAGLLTGGSTARAAGLDGDPDLVAHWDFNEGSGHYAYNKVAAGDDYAALWQDGQPEWTTGRTNSGAGHFDGVRRMYVSGTGTDPLEAIDAEQKFTFAATLKADAVDVPRGIVGNNGFQVRLEQGGYLTIQAGGMSFTTSAGALTAGHWHHIAASYDAGSLAVYVDGVSVHTAANVNAIDFGDGMQVGFLGWGEKLLGAIDDIRFYDRVLSDAEVQALANDTAAPTAPTNVTVTDVQGEALSLTWNASSDLIGVAAYEVYLDEEAEPVATVSSTAAAVTGLTPNTTYSLTVKAKDAAGNLSIASEPVTATTATKPSLNHDPDLVGHWYMNEGSGDNINDSTGLNAVAQMPGPGWTTGRFSDGAVSFDGAKKFYLADGLNGLNEVKTTQEMTFVMTFKPLSPASEKGLYARNNFRLSISGDNKLIGYVGTSYFETAANTIAQDAWNQVAIIYKNDTIRTFINGQLQSTVNDAADLDASNALFLGSNGWGSNFKGTIDDVRVYKRALSLSDIGTLYQDATAPTTPSGLMADAAAGDSITINWTSAFDNVGIYAYKVYVGGAETPALTVKETTATVTGLASGSHTLRVKAMDEAGNESAAAEVTAWTDDVTPPGAPAGLMSSGRTAASIDLGWQAAADDRGVTEYRVYEGNNIVPVATTVGTGVTISGLTASTTYSFTVKAVDAAGNLSSASEQLRASTLYEDAVVPSKPEIASIGSITDKSMQVVWNVSTDNTGIASYEVYAGAEKIATVPAPARHDLYSFDSGIPPIVAPAGGAAASHDPTAGREGSGAVKLTWPASEAPVAYNFNIDSPIGIDSDNGVLSGYVYIPESTRMNDAGLSIFATGWAWNGGFTGSQAPKGQWIPIHVKMNGNKPSPRISLVVNATDAGTVYFDSLSYGPGTASSVLTGLNADADYSITVKAEDLGGNVSEPSAAVTARTLTLDAEAPAAPANLEVSQYTHVSATLEWSASMDNREVAEYRIYEGNGDTPVGTVFSVPDQDSYSYTVTGLNRSTAYSFTVKAVDTSDNESAASQAAEVTTRENVSNENSALGINLSSLDDWQTQQPFKDLFKTAREWNNWAAPETLDLDENGWVKSLQEGQTAYSLLMIDTQGKYPGGEYTLLYDGEGELKIEWDARVVGTPTKSGNTTRTLLDVTPGAGIRLTIMDTDPNNTGNYIRNIRLMQTKYEENYEEEPFNPDFLDLWRGFKVIRYMDLMHTNDSKVSNWEDRTQPNRYTQSTGSGMAVEYMVELANTLETDMWINIPHKATDDYVSKFAAYLKENLNSDLRVYIEWSNETWNSQFGQSAYASAEGKKLGYTGSDLEIAMKYHGHRAKQVFALFDEVYGADKTRLFRILGGFHHGGAWLTNMLVSQDDVYQVADAVAIAPYFGHAYGTEKAEQVKNWTMNQLFADLPAEVEDALSRAEEVIDAAAMKGLPVFAYEGGQHMVGAFYNGTAYWDDAALTAKLIEANRDPRMKGIYDSFLNGWKEIGGRWFMIFSSMGLPSKWGSWGILEHSLQQPNQVPKYSAVTEFMQNHPKWWDDSDRPVIVLPPAVESATAKKGLDFAQIDGELNEAMWSLTNPVGKNVNGVTNNTAHFDTFWDDSGLYVAVKVMDAAIVNDSADAYQDDSVEIYIDANRNKAAAYDSYDRQLTFGFGDAAVSTGHQKDGIVFAMEEIEGGYVLEAAIPWSNLGITPEPDTIIGFDIGVNDDDDGGNRESQVMWSGENNNWQSTERFGDVTLSSETVGEAQNPIMVENLTFTDLEGEPVSALDANTFVRAAATIRNRGPAEKNAALIAVLKNAVGEILNLSVVEKRIAGNQSEVFSAGFLLPDNTQDCTLEIYVWDGLDTMAPLSNKAVFPQPQ